MSHTIRATARGMSYAAVLAMGHADASHGGTMTPDCERCVTLAAACGVDIAPPPEACEHTDTVARVGTNLAWECTRCGRVEDTGRSLLDVAGDVDLSGLPDDHYVDCDADGTDLPCNLACND